jgi:hypothetical protein
MSYWPTNTFCDPGLGVGARVRNVLFSPNTDGRLDC